MIIPFLDMKSITIRHESDLLEAMRKVLNSGWYIQGEQKKLFEKLFSDYCGTKFCIGVGNGLEALFLVLKAWDIGEGDEVIVPSNTYIATWLAVSHCGAKPIPVEPDMNTFNINPDLIEKSITKNTKAIIPVHLYGLAADMNPIIEIAKSNKLKVLSDAAQGHGAHYFEKAVSSFGDATAYSFYPTKNLGALGDAGAITTNDELLAKKLQSISNYGSKEKYINDEIGYNSRLDEIQAAILIEKLKHLDIDNAQRSKIAERYSALLKKEKNLTLPFIPEGYKHVWHLYVIRTKYREQLKKAFEKSEIGYLIHYPISPHLQKAYSGSYLSFNLKIAEQLQNEVISLPMGPSMKIEEVDYVCEVIIETLRNI